MEGAGKAECCVLPPRMSGLRQTSVQEPGVSWVPRLPRRLLEIWAAGTSACHLCACSCHHSPFQPLSWCIFLSSHPAGVGGSLSVDCSRWGNRTWKSKSTSKAPILASVEQFGRVPFARPMPPRWAVLHGLSMAPTKYCHASQILHPVLIRFVGCCSLT